MTDVEIVFTGDVLVVDEEEVARRGDTVKVSQATADFLIASGDAEPAVAGSKPFATKPDEGAAPAELAPSTNHEEE